MKKYALHFPRLIPLTILLFSGYAGLAGGLLTNTNQSTQFVRMPSRNASLQIDGVYYNPAGLIKMENGWHFAVYNQSIWQDKTVYSAHPLLNNRDYLGTVRAPFFPNAYAVFKIKNWAFSLGFGPNAGGGAADFKEGLPTFEIPLAKLGSGLKQISPLVTSFGFPAATGYDASLSFKGSSVFTGIQFGITSRINDILSFYAGVRYVQATNTYSGLIKDITVKTSIMDMSAGDYINSISSVVSPTIALLNDASVSLQSAISAGLLQPNDPLTNPQIITYLQYIGVSGTTNQGAVTLLTGTKNRLETLMNADVSDKVVDVTQTDDGWTPIVGLNISPAENLNIALKYEHKTYMVVINDTKADSLGLFRNGGKSRSDIPGILAAGIGYKPFSWLETQISYNYYFDNYVNWLVNVRELGAHNRQTVRTIDQNTWELAMGLQFNISSKFALSTGILTSNPGVNDSYQSDFSYTNPSVTVSGGMQWKITKGLTFDLGFLNTFYKDVTVIYEDPDIPGGQYSDTLGKSTYVLSAGLSYSVFR